MVVKDKANGEKLTPYEIAEKQSKIVGLEFSREQVPKGKVCLVIIIVQKITSKHQISRHLTYKIHFNVFCFLFR